jgi:hypothetical protein
MVRTFTLTRASAAVLVIVASLAACGTPRTEETGPVDAATVQKLETVLHARADAMGRGDLKAFTQTIDTTKPAFRRIQQRLFDLPIDFFGLQSAFKLSGAEHYLGYIRAFVDQSLEGNAFLGVFAGMRQQSRLYFREVDGRWVLTEPVGSEAGEEKRRAVGDAMMTYWAMDEDVADVFARGVSDAFAFVAKQAPKPVSFKSEVVFVPTAELAGPGWDVTIGWNSYSGTTPPRYRIYPLWYGLDSAREQVSAYGQFLLRAVLLERMRDALIPGARSRLSNEVWLDLGWNFLLTGVDFSAVLRQSCAGIPVLTAHQLAAGYPPLGTPGVTGATFVRYIAFSVSMVAYLFERFGPDAYWRLLDAYVQNASTPANFPAVLKTTVDDFYAAWLTWLNKKYC